MLHGLYRFDEDVTRASQWKIDFAKRRACCVLEALQFSPSFELVLLHGTIHLQDVQIMH